MVVSAGSLLSAMVRSRGRGKMWTAIDDGDWGLRRYRMLGVGGLGGAEWKRCGGGTRCS